MVNRCNVNIGLQNNIIVTCIFSCAIKTKLKGQVCSSVVDMSLECGKVLGSIPNIEKTKKTNNHD